MSLQLSGRQRNIQWAAREFAQKEFEADLVLDLDRTGQFPRTIWEKACQLGFVGIYYPKEYGGVGLGVFEQVLVIEEFCRADSGIGIALATPDLGSEAILKFGNEKQKETFLVPLAKGKAISSLLYPVEEEQGAKSSSFILRKMEKDQYSLNGYGEYVLNGSLANFLVVCCSLQCEKNLFFVLIEKGTKGLKMVEMGKKLGMRMIPWHKLTIHEVEISQENILGLHHEGVDQLIEVQKALMIKVGGLALGIAQGAFDRALAYAKQREQFGKKIAEFQGIRHKLADLYIKIKAARLLIYNAASNYDLNKNELCDIVTAQLFAERTAIEATDEALQIFGGAGYMIETPVEHYYRDARIMRTLTGQEIPLKDIIAQSVIGRTA
jgi:alkylation response protein AidB-like acyl-CoA dehydrogenase